MAANECKWNSVTVDNEGHDLRLSLTIKNFLDYVCKPGEKLETLQMDCTQFCGAKWVLQVFAYGHCDQERDQIGVYLKLAEKPFLAELVTATFEFSVLGLDGRKVKVSGPSNGVEEQLLIGYGTNNLITRSEIASNRGLYLSNGHLTIRCEGKAFLDKPNQSLTIRNLSHNVVSSQPLKVLRKVYEEEIYSDVVLKTGSSEFKCHKAILTATSNYFKAMFGHDLNREMVVDLSKDLRAEELKVLLDYIYLGKRDFWSSKLPHASVQNLYRVSETYEIGGLKGACESELIRQLNLENARELIVFAIEFRAKRLEVAAASIIVNRSNC